MLNFIVNESSSSGKGKIVWMEIQNILEERNVQYRFWLTKKPGHATQIAKTLCRQQAGEIDMIVIGGDGTINEIVNGITDFDRVRLGVIPTGSGNDLARGIGLKGNTEQHINRIINCKKDYRIDLGRVKYEDNKNGKYFVISSGVGMDALVCKKVNTSNLKKTLNKFHLGKLTYIIITIQSLFTMNYSDMKSVYDGNRKLKLDDLIFMSFMNFSAEGGGVPMAPRADATDGKLSACACYNISKWGALLRLPLLIIKKHEKLKCFRMVECENGEMNLAKPMALHTDGEYLGDVTWVKYECVKGKLRFMM